ncbi:MAG: hypothetical protein KDA90_03735 [Planctomycetaceae bacterium]|nr:hypothetical protein [Planctomycetaceae bacterium]
MTILDKLLNPHVLGWLGAVSVLMFVCSLWLIPIIIVRIPTDYFLHSPRWHRAHSRHPVIAWSLFFARNVFGLTLIVMGIAMLVLPGQGVITILLGLMLTTIPGKHRVALEMFRLPRVLSAVQWLRQRRGVPPLEFPPRPEPPAT